MSGGGYAVSKKGAAKILKTFPCVEGVCSMAIDWHYSTLIARGLINVYANVKPITAMPDQGAIQAYAVPSPTDEETLACGGKYFSDTHYEKYKGGHTKRVETEYERWMAGTSNIRSGPPGSSVSIDRPFIALLGPTSWADADKACAAHGGRLASIRSAEENSKAGRLMYKQCGHVKTDLAGWDQCAWIGLNDFSEEGRREWVDRWTGPYENFVQGEPNNFNNNEDGMAMCWSFGNKWIDFSNASPLPCTLCRLDEA